MNENDRFAPLGSRANPRRLVLNLPQIADEFVIEQRVDDLTFENRALPKHDPWFEEFVPRLVKDTRGRRVQPGGGRRAVDEPVVVPHHRPGIAVDSWIVPADGGPVWREDGACFRCFDGRYAAENDAVGIDLVIEPLLFVWVRGDHRTIVEVGLCRMCAMELNDAALLAPKFKMWPSAAV